MMPPALATKSGAQRMPRAASSRRARPRRAGCSPRRRSPAPASAGRTRRSSTPPRAQGTSTSAAASSALAGVIQRAPRRRASLAPARSMSAATSCAPARRASSGDAQADVAEPETATVRPFSEVAVRTRARTEARMAASTPRAVHGLGSPDPPLAARRPQTCAVPLRDDASCHATRSPRPRRSCSAPPSTSTVSAKSSRSSRARRPSGRARRGA